MSFMWFLTPLKEAVLEKNKVIGMQKYDIINIIFILFWIQPQVEIMYLI